MAHFDGGGRALRSLRTRTRPAFPLAVATTIGHAGAGGGHDAAGPGGDATASTPDASPS